MMSTKLCDHDTTLIERAALGELRDAERQLLDARLATCPACRARLDDYRALLGGMTHLFDDLRQAAAAQAERGLHMAAPTDDDLRQPLAPVRARRQLPRRPVALAGGLIAAALIVALAGIFAFLGPGRDTSVSGNATTTVAATQGPLNCTSSPTPHAVGNIGGAIGTAQFWVGGFTGTHATYDVRQSPAWQHGHPAKVVTQFAAGATQPVTLTGTRLSDGSALWFQFDTYSGPSAPDSTHVAFSPANGPNDVGYILISSTGCYALTARWATGSWTVTFQGIV